VAFGDEQYTIEEVAQGLRKAGGIFTSAAKNIGCTRKTVSDYVKRYPELQDIVDEGHARMLDLAENNLLTGLKAGDKTMTIFVLKCFGKSRGYIQSQQVEHVGNVTVVNFKGVPLEEIEEIAGESGPAQGGQGGRGSPSAPDKPEKVK